MKQKAIIFDLDACIVDSSSRFNKIDLDAFERKDHNTFARSLEKYQENTKGDEVIDDGIDLLVALTNFYKPDRVFFLTARGSGAEKITLNWLKQENIWDSNYQLICRPEDLDSEDYKITDQLDHAKFKKETARKLMETYEILMCVDDSSLNCACFVELGLTTLQFHKANLGRMLV